MWDPAALTTVLERSDVVIWWRPAHGAARVVSGPQPGFPALAFEQINPELARRLHRDAVEGLGAAEGSVVWDLYAGVGDTARALADLGARVWAVEVDRSAVEWADRRIGGSADRRIGGSLLLAARRQPGSNGSYDMTIRRSVDPSVRRSADPSGGVRWLAGRVEESLHRLPEPAYAIVNPPRAGMDRRVTARLEALTVAGILERVVYVSCDPATLARDLTRMPTLAVARLAAYDLFPQTSHVETLAVLEPAR